MLLLRARGIDAHDTRYAEKELNGKEFDLYRSAHPYSDDPAEVAMAAQKLRDFVAYVEQIYQEKTGKTVHFDVNQDTLYRKSDELLKACTEQ